MENENRFGMLAAVSRALSFRPPAAQTDPQPGRLRSAAIIRHVGGFFAGASRRRRNRGFPAVSATLGAKTLLLLAAFALFWGPRPQAQQARKVLSSLECRMLADTFTKIGSRMELADIAKLRHCLTRLIFEKRRAAGVSAPKAGVGTKMTLPAQKQEAAPTRPAPGYGPPGSKAPGYGPPAGRNQPGAMSPQEAKARAATLKKKRMEAIRRRMQGQGKQMKRIRPGPPHGPRAGRPPGIGSGRGRQRPGAPPGRRGPGPRPPGQEKPRAAPAK